MKRFAARLTAMGIALATALGLVVIAAPAASADWGSITASYGYGSVKTTRLINPLRLRVNAYVKDTVCNSEAVVLKYDVRDNDGYLLVRHRVHADDGCGRSTESIRSYGLSTLDYERSGYVSFYLCKDAWVDWGCTGDRVIGWDL